MNVRFVVTRPESKRRSFDVRLPIIVGRGDEAKFRIQQDRVSRKHCEFFAQDGGVHVRDLGSTNGTFVNGRLVETSVKVPLEPGALIRVGGLEFRVEFDAAGGAAAAASVDHDAVADRTVTVAQAAESERLQIEHVPEEPAADEPALTSERPADDEARPVVEAAGPVIEPAESPAPEPEVPEEPAPAMPGDEAFAGIGDPAAPPAAEGFDFLSNAGAADTPAEEDQLGDFLKGLG